MNGSKRRIASLLLVGSLGLCFALAGCSFTEANEKKKKSWPAPSRPAPEPVAPTAPSPDRLGPARLMRRITLDLSLRLPAQVDMDALAADKTKLPSLVEAQLVSGDAPRALAALHERIWGLNADSLPDLDDFIEAGNTALEASLTDSLRAQIVEESTLLVRHVLQNQLPFSDIFTANYTLIASDALTFFELSDDGSVWSGEPYHFATYSDGRPAAGLLATNGFRAAYSTYHDSSLRRRTSRMLRELTCTKTENPVAHRFYELSAEELASDLAQLATQRSPCMGCHSHFVQTAPAFSGFGLATSFSNWLTYTAPASEPTGYYAGHPYTGLSELAAYVGNDPRTHRCEIEKLTNALYHRPHNAADYEHTALAIDQFYQHDLDLMKAMREIVLSPEYSFSSIVTATRAESQRNSSGMRFLRRHHWRGVIMQLAPRLAAIDIPAALDPGTGEFTGSDEFLPSGAYFHYADRLAQQIATAIVAEELQDGIPATARRVLTDLPDGSGSSASDTVVYQQMVNLWKRLTTEELAPTSPLYINLQTLWNEAKATSGADDFRRAWRVVLVAMLTHPTFMSY